MKRLLIALALVSLVVLSGCYIVPIGPVYAPITVGQKGPVAVGDTNAAAMKVGVARAEGIILVSFGDASISTAAASAGIKKIHHVDCEVLNILGIYGRYETVVYGE